jgi:predicted helicase
MPNELKDIRTFPQLVAYLRDEMHWPISGDHFEKLTFDFTPEELGIDMKNAAKVKEIKQLRPFSANQPWGIFFVNFEPKQLPVVALRRILSSLALKQRASANESDRKAWSQDDLLFVSNYGEGEERKICLAHFAQSDKKKDLPVLKVLGWDNLDTPLHLDHVADVLTEKLTWPSDGDDVDHWRSQWRSAFTLEHRETIKTSKKLAIALAELARNIRARINEVLRIETEDGRLTKLMSAFKEALVHDLDEDGFADMYAQTIAYGLLSARIANPKGDTADGVAAAMPVTNPFLKELMETFLHTGGRDTKNKKGTNLDFDELGVGDVVALLDRAKMEEIVLDFGDKNPQEDPIVKFYEDFLHEYDPVLRKQLGVFYTPREAVSCMVHSVNERLRTDFGLADGLADITSWSVMADRFEEIKIPEGVKGEMPFVQILDPATGTGTFLAEAILLIHEIMQEKWQTAGNNKKQIEKLWNEYVSEHLLSRLHGYELMMAPYTIAHLKIGITLLETGYSFLSDSRANVYLTNALDPPKDYSGTFDFDIPALSHEIEAVNSIKQNKHFTIIIGNPPYSIMSQNLSIDARALIDAYRYVNGKKIVERAAIQVEKNLQDDYIKFIRIAEMHIQKSGFGVVCIVCNHGFIDSLTLRGVRASILNSFDKIYILDMHGNSLKGEVSPEECEKDENIFSIVSVGVSINLLSKVPQSFHSTSQVFHIDLWGLKSEKLDWLSRRALKENILIPISSVEPEYLFVPQDELIRAEYVEGTLISDIFIQRGKGIVTSRDDFVIRHSKTDLLNNVSKFRDAIGSESKICNDLGLRMVNNWKIKKSQDLLKNTESLENCIRRIQYRPFDFRYIFYHKSLVSGMSKPTMKHIRPDLDNIGLVISRTVRGAPWRDILASRVLIEFGVMATRPGNYAPMLPLYTYPSKDELLFGSEKLCNLNKNFIKDISEKLSLKWIDEGRGDLKKEGTIGPEDIVAFIYSQLHSTKFRIRYAEFMRSEFPRIFQTNNMKLFLRLVELGSTLLKLHLFEMKLPEKPKLEIVDIRDAPIEKISYSEETAWIDKNKTRGFSGIPTDVWKYYIGGYQVCEKWLKGRQPKGGRNPRKGFVLTDEDINHFQKIVVTISETIRIVGEIDEVIEEHGGWPDAFVTNTESEE